MANLTQGIKEISYDDSITSLIWSWDTGLTIYLSKPAYLAISRYFGCVYAVQQHMYGFLTSC